MSITRYPPIAAPTLDQELLISLAGARVQPSQYKTLDFSPLFLSIYGRPTLTYRSWARLWSIPCSHILEALRPRYPYSTMNFLAFAECEERFVGFCIEVDSYYGWLGEDGRGRRRDGRREGATPVGRGEMEGAWVRVLVGLFEEMRGEKERMRGFVGMRGGRGEGGLLMSIKDVEGEMREVLRAAVEQRFSKEAEEYWARKWKIYGYRCPDLDVERVTDWSVEAPYQKSLLKPEDINDNDYEETDDENDNENKQKNESEGEDNNDAAVAMDGVEMTQESMIRSTQERKSNSIQEQARDLASEDSDATLDAKQHVKKKHNQEANPEEPDETASTKENMKQEMRLEEKDGGHGTLAFRH